jgi:NADPH:quinone reductase-like Zn-dependent oxidoreductase
MNLARNTTAVRIYAFGGPGELQLDQLPMPEPRAGEVLIEVHAASVNPVDYKIREGKYPAVKEDKLPYTMGRDVSGVVVKSGSGAAAKAGQPVFGMLGIERGGYAEHVILKDGEFAPKPQTLDHIASAAVPLAGLTAWQGLFRHGRLLAGQRVLIHGGAGGVGHFAIQFAKAKGAEVVTTVSAQHVDFARALGADQVIDYKHQRFEEAAGQVDLVYDLIAGDTQQRSWQVLRDGGTMVSTLAEPSQEEARKRGVRALRYTVEPDSAELTEIAGLIDAGKVRPKVSKVFHLDEAAEAEEYVKRGHTEGKVVLRVRDD